MYVREPAAPFVSMAEMMRKFQSETKEVSLPRGSCSISQSDAGATQRKPKLTLTRPKTPEFETSQRVRSFKLKSSAEIEKEVMAKVPKFKARPLNKKVKVRARLSNPLPNMQAVKGGMCGGFRIGHTCDRGYGDYGSYRRYPYSYEEEYDRSYMGRHFGDTYPYDDVTHGIKRPHYMMDQDPNLAEPSRYRSRLDHSDPAVPFRGTRYREELGGDGGLYRQNYYGVPNTSSMDVDDEEISMLDDLEQHFILRKDNEIPSTYLASLSAKISANDDETSVVRGKIKGFQFKQRESYELQVYVDDGSLISEIFIDHRVEQNRIGYSPQEVTNALASSESKCVSEMKEIMKKFQIF
ncbi:hypothetical protein ACS0TY_017295 [Phlomoides rotata]